ncbi:MAG TPA: chromosome segregation protein SMC [Acidimicrobiia bacterium]|nr:chromosome segregation protein SMC [Acidimicrobiia bacterium]
MLLKSLSLAGFKSFATRTRLDFESGVTVVVGPNGSGKSNLLDALSWVMGTQATSALRTGKMEDVIFAGTATRPSMGRAEVTVTFDNIDRFLPLDLDEISMTRRLYRDGRSEYEINGAPCRLLDLHELLSDGGVGRHQHVLVGQGQIGTILNARPDEHRAVIEEAAGVTKHRNRRDRSLRRLEQTALDIERLNDLLDQERRRLRPLKRQANAAARYDSVKAEAQALRLWLGGEELRRITTRTEIAAAQKADLEAAIAAHGAELATLRSSLDELRSAAGEVGKALERDTAAAARLETAAERFQRFAMVARERRFSLQSRLEGAGERRRDLEVEQAYLTDELASLEVELRSTKALAERREAELHVLEDEERSLAEQAQLPAEGVIANLRGDLRALEVAAERDERELASLSRRRDVVHGTLETQQAEAEALVAVIQETDIAAVETQEVYEQALAERERAEDAHAGYAADDRAAQLAVAHAAARAEAIEGALQGLGDPEARERAARADGVVGAVVARLDVPESLAAAVDGALGHWSDAFVADGPASINRITAELKGAGFGGVTLVIGRTVAETPPALEVAAASGAEALVDSLGANADRRLAHHLLGDVVVVEGWSSGWRLVERHPQIRAVTPEGDVISIDGIRLADADGAGHAALEAARVALEQAETAAARTASHLTTATRALERAGRAEREALDTLERIEAKLAGHSEALGINGRARAEGEAEGVRLDERAIALADAARLRDDRMGEVRRRLAEFEGEEQERQRAWEALMRTREDVTRRRNDARVAREEAAAAVASAEERHRMLTGRLQQATTDLEDIDATPVEPARVETLRSIEERARQADDQVREHVAALRERQRTLRKEAGVAGERLDEAHRRERELDRAIAEAKEQASTLAIELAELRVRKEATAEALRRDADASETIALEAPRPDIAPDEDLPQLLASREAELRRMGPINPLAAAEYEELAGHVELLEGQLADLEESRTELRKVITALDDEMAKLFAGAFDEISRLYEENFALVFPGGRGRLRLTDPEKPLEAGVEIEAQPLGKKVGRLSLLSGGERSLAALAFLFAVFRARPSPFYVLDEVEAALDDANLRRFLRLVDTLREQAQLVIITHQQQTMEAADLLYGVTMEPAESSKVIAKRLERARTDQLAS